MSLLLKHISAAGTEYNLDSVPGSYVITGFSANSTRERALSGSAGSYVITGSPANLIKGYELSSQVGVYSITGFNADLSTQQVAAQPAGKPKKRLDLTQYNREMLRKILEEEIEEVAEDQKAETPTPSNAVALGLFDPAVAIESAMPRVVDSLISQGAENAIPTLRIIYGEMLKKAKADALEAEDIEFLLLAA